MITAAPVSTSVDLTLVEPATVEPFDEAESHQPRALLERAAGVTALAFRIWWALLRP